MIAVLAFIALPLICVSSAHAQNRTPGSPAAACLQPYEYDFNADDGAAARTILGQNGYDCIFFSNPTPPTLLPNMTMGQLQGQFQRQPGVLYISSHGGAHGFGYEVRPWSPEGETDTEQMYYFYTQGGPWQPNEIFYGSVDGVGWHIGLTPQGIQNRFISSQSLVHVAVCDSDDYASRWQALAVLSYDGTSWTPFVPSHSYLIWNRLGGNYAPLTNRILSNAIINQGVLLYGAPNVVIAPTIQSFLPAANTTLDAPVTGQVTFDAEMAQDNPEGVVDGGSFFLVSESSWLSASTLQFKVTPYRVGTGPICVKAEVACSGPGGAALDGDGVSPNGDDKCWNLTSTVHDENTVAAFEFAAAWKEVDGVHIAFITGAERRSAAMNVYSSANASAKPLIAIPPQGGGWRAHYYEIVLESGAAIYQVVEEDSSGASNYATPPFAIGPIPPSIKMLRQLNAEAATWPDPLVPGRYPEPSAKRSTQDAAALATDYVFYSTRQDFLDAVEPVKDHLLSLGRSSQSVLSGSPDPETARSLLEPIYLQALQEHKPIPFVYILGEANEGAVPAYNVVGTEYHWDTENICIWNPCASDIYMVDFDHDLLPDMNWSRIIAHDVQQVQNSIASYFDALEAQPTQKILFLIGDYDRTPLPGHPVEEPRDTLEEIIEWYQADGISTQALYDSDFGTMAWAARRDASAAAIATGITEIGGAGMGSTRNNLCYLIQKEFGDPSEQWSMGHAPRLQRIVGQFPGCGMGDSDRNNITNYPAIPAMFLTADPAAGTTAVAWHSEARGGHLSFHILKALSYFAHRLSGAVTSTHDAHFRAIRELGTQHPEMKWYLYGSVNYGWEIRMPGMLIAVEGEQEASPVPPHVLRAFPNPFNSLVGIEFSVPRAGRVEVDVVDVTGRVVARLVNGIERAGTHRTFWNGKNAAGHRVASGTYFVRQRSGSVMFSTKLVFSR